MKDELDMKGNKYEILDFLWAQTKAVIGIESLPPTQSVLREDVLERDRRLGYLSLTLNWYRLYRIFCSHREADPDYDYDDIPNFDEDEDPDADKNVEDLPQKVNVFHFVGGKASFDLITNV